MKPEIYDLASLRTEVRKGYRPKYMFFWGHRPKKDGTIGKQCFSQWWHAPFEVNGICYMTAEHYMMAEKARMFNDTAMADKIIVAKNPGAAKALGREIKGFDETIWTHHRFEIVVTGNHAKFNQNAELKEFLLNTKNRVLVEASPVDKIWGIGLAEDSPSASNPESWNGLNLLGFALMKVRTRLMNT